MLLSTGAMVDPNNGYRNLYGDVYGLYLGSMPLVIVHDMDILKEVLVKQFNSFTDRVVLDLNPYPVNLGLFFESGANWHRLRNILSPTFTGGKLRHMCGQINRCAESLSDKMAEKAKSKSVVDVKEFFGGYTMDTIASTAFGIHVDSQNEPNNPFVAHARKVFKFDIFTSPLMMLATMFPRLCPLLRACGVHIFSKDSVQFFVKTVEQMFRERQQSAGDHMTKDFLDLLMNARDNTTNEESVNDNKRSKKMTTDEIFGQAFLFFAAGYETTATALQFMAYALATNPDVQDKLISEIRDGLGEDEPTYDNIQELKYLDNVIQETLRMYPPVPGLSRKPAKTVTIKGYTFTEDMGINVPVLQMGRDPELFDEPNKFRPERWDERERNPLSWLPFGYGPRLCIGMRLAQVELKIATIYVLRRVKFVRLPDTPDEVKFKVMGTLAPRDPLKLRVELL